jgi:hypothetical protein
MYTMFKYAALLAFLVLIGFSGYKIQEHKDDKDVTKLSIYSAAAGISSIVVIFLLYDLLSKMRVDPLKEEMIDNILEDFLNPTVI